MWGGQVTLSKLDNICSLTIQSQIFTISMHIPSNVKIHWYLLKLLSANQNMGSRMDVRQKYGQTHGWPTWNHNTQLLLCGWIWKTKHMQHKYKTFIFLYFLYKLSMLGKISVLRLNLKYYSCFYQKQYLTFHANCLLTWKQGLTFHANCLLDN